MLPILWLSYSMLWPSSSILYCVNYLNSGTNLEQFQCYICIFSRDYGISPSVTQVKIFVFSCVLCHLSLVISTCYMTSDELIPSTFTLFNRFQKQKHSILDFCIWIVKTCVSYRRHVLSHWQVISVCMTLYVFVVDGVTGDRVQQGCGEPNHSTIT